MPRSRSTWVASLLGAMFIGVSFLARQYGIVPRDSESVVSQVAAQVFGGRGIPYYLVQAATILILLLATNTSFADFPRLGSILARDGFLPHQFQFRGDRLAFTTGIVALTVASGALLVAFHGQTNQLIPLFAIGAFLAFTFSQAGMVQHWRHMPGNHRRSMLINGAGAVTTGVTSIVIAVSKFRDGAWITVLIIPVLVLLFLGISRHYTRVERELAPTEGDSDPLLNAQGEQIVIVPVAAINKATLHALAYARRLSSTGRRGACDGRCRCGSGAAAGLGEVGHGRQPRHPRVAVPFADRAAPLLHHPRAAETPAARC